MDPKDIKQPHKTWGITRVYAHMKMTPGVKTVAHEEAQRLTKLLGFRVSIGNIFETAFLQQTSKDNRRKAETINKEWKSNDKKYMDIKKAR